MVITVEIHSDDRRDTVVMTIFLPLVSLFKCLSVRHSMCWFLPQLCAFGYSKPTLQSAFTRGSFEFTVWKAPEVCVFLMLVLIAWLKLEHNTSDMCYTEHKHIGVRTGRARGVHARPPPPKKKIIK